MACARRASLRSAAARMASHSAALMGRCSSCARWMTRPQRWAAAKPAAPRASMALRARMACSVSLPVALLKAGLQLLLDVKQNALRVADMGERALGRLLAGADQGAGGVELRAQGGELLLDGGSLVGVDAAHGQRVGGGIAGGDVAGIGGVDQLLGVLGRRGAGAEQQQRGQRRKQGGQAGCAVHGGPHGSFLRSRLAVSPATGPSAFWMRRMIFCVRVNTATSGVPGVIFQASASSFTMRAAAPMISMRMRAKSGMRLMISMFYSVRLYSVRARRWRR